MERHREMLSDGCKVMFGTDKPAAATESSVFGERAARASKPIDSEVQARLRTAWRATVASREILRSLRSFRAPRMLSL
jgi:hypothetical protein